MGVDAQIRFPRNMQSAEQIHELAYDLARWVGGDKFYTHPCLEVRDGFVHVLLWSRHYGPGYERGDWPNLRAMLAFLVNRVPGVEYADDSSDVWMPAAEVIEENDAHWLNHGYPYRWNDWRHDRDLPPRCTWPNDSYGKPMVRFGWGGNYAAFSSPADHTKQVWSDGRWLTAEEMKERDR